MHIDLGIVFDRMSALHSNSAYIEWTQGPGLQVSVIKRILMMMMMQDAARFGEVVHIDLGIVFDQGKLLSIPELLPFRLTRDMVDGMGTLKVYEP